MTDTNPYASPASSDASAGYRKLATWRRIVGVLLLVLGVAIFAACLRVFVLLRATEHVPHRRAIGDRPPNAEDQTQRMWPPLEDPASSIYVREEVATRMLILPLLSGALALAGVWIGFRRRTALWLAVLVVASVLAFELFIMFGSPPEAFV